MESKYQSTRINEIIPMKPGTWFIADIIGLGIYEMVENGINHTGSTYANVRLKKLFMNGFKWIGHVTNCHPINIDRWNTFKIVKDGK